MPLGAGNQGVKPGVALGRLVVPRKQPVLAIMPISA